jgi:hypothetical protein
VGSIPVDLPFAGLSELCAGRLDHVGALPEPHARALEGALARREVPRADRFAIGAAVVSLLSGAGKREPVLPIVDDARSLDASSADALLFAAQRLRSEGVAMLVATRPEGIFDAERSGVPRTMLRGLDPASSRALLDAAHGVLPGPGGEAAG